MFDNKFTKRDALAESVKQVMLENEIRRQVEFTLNEQLGIHSKNALPHEHHAQYDAILKEAIHNALSEGQWPKKNMIREEENPPYKGTGTGSNIFDPREGDFHILDPQGRTVAVYNRENDAKRAVKGFPEGHRVLPAKNFSNFKEYQEKKPKGAPKALEEKKIMSKSDIAALRPPEKKVDGGDLAALRAGKHLNEKATESQKEKVHKVMGEFKRKKLHSGSKEGPVVKSREQAVAIALDQAGLSKKRVDESLESILEEIVNNLQEQFVYIYENGDYDMMNEFLGSLTEEQAALLGLSEQQRVPSYYHRQVPSDKKKMNETVGEIGPWPGASRLRAVNDPKALPRPQSRAPATIPPSQSGPPATIPPSQSRPQSSPSRSFARAVPKGNVPPPLSIPLESSPSSSQFARAVPKGNVPPTPPSGIVPTIKNFASKVVPFAKPIGSIKFLGPLSTALSIADYKYGLANQASIEGIRSGRVKLYKDSEIGTDSPLSLKARILAAAERGKKDVERIPRSLRPIDPYRSNTAPVAPKPAPAPAGPPSKQFDPIGGAGEFGTEPARMGDAPPPAPAPAGPTQKVGPSTYSDPDMPDKTAGPRKAPPAGPTPAGTTPAPKPPEEKENNKPKPFSALRSGDKPAAPSWTNDMGGGGALQNRSRAFGADRGA